MKLFPTTRRNARDMLSIAPSTNLALNALMVFLAILTLAPFYIIVIASITSEASLTQNGYRLWPEEFSLNATLTCSGKARLSSPRIATRLFPQWLAPL
ncbi:MAG: hypothetical protein ACK4SA_20025 [Caldilinea sp.]